MVRMKAIFDINASAAGLVDYTIRLYHPGDVVDTAAISCGNWADLGAVFDQYRVHALKIKYVSQVKNEDNASRANQVAYGLVDWDSQTNTDTNFAALSFADSRTLDLTRNWKKYIKLKRISDPTAVQVGSMSWNNIAAPQYAGIFRFFGSGYTASVKYGIMVLTYYVEMKLQR